jgi:hypothetical protein
MVEVVALAEKLAAISFPALLLLILIGSYYEVWVWGRQHREAKAELKDWKQIALRSLNVAGPLVDRVTGIGPGERE